MGPWGQGQTTTAIGGARSGIRFPGNIFWSSLWMISIKKDTGVQVSHNTCGGQPGSLGESLITKGCSAEPRGLKKFKGRVVSPNREDTQ